MTDIPSLEARSTPEWKAQGTMWLDELAVFAMMCCALTWALLNREGRRLLTAREVRAVRSR